MVEITTVIAAAERLSTKNEEALALEIGLRSKHIEGDPGSANNPALTVTYSTHMGTIDDLKALGWRISVCWNERLHGVVCFGNEVKDRKVKRNILDALSFNEVALITAVAPALIWLGAPAAIAAAAAPFIVRKFILPAKDELCATWSEGITEEG